MSQQQPNPDLIQIQDDTATPTATAPAGHNNNEGSTNPAALVPNQAKITLNFFALAIFLTLTLYKADHQQLWALTALITPILLILKLSHDKGGFKKIPFAQMLTRFTVGFVLLLPVMIMVCALFVGLLMSLFAPKVEERPPPPPHRHELTQVPPSTTLNYNSNHQTATPYPAEQQQAEPTQVWDIKMMIFIVSLVTAEELVKLMMYLTQDKRSEMKDNPVHFIYFGLSTALGLVCAEVYFAVREVSLMFYGDQSFDSGDGYNAPPRYKVETSQIISLVIIFSGFLIPMQLIASYYIGLASARVQVLDKPASREFPLPLFVTILFRTMFLYSIGLILPASQWVGMGLAFACYILLVWIVLRYQEGMPREYLKQTGSLNILGYGVIAGSEDEAGSAPQQENTVVGNEEDDPDYNGRRQTTTFGDPNGNNAAAEFRTEIHREVDHKTGQETKIEIVLPPMPSIGSTTAAGGSGSVRTMFDTVGNGSTSNTTTNTNNDFIPSIYDDETEDGEELHDIK